MGESSQLRPRPQADEPTKHNWKAWLQELQDYATITDLDSISGKLPAATFQSSLGRAGQEVISALFFDLESERNDTF